ncbi:HIT family protein [Patescibacteria group bacterium]|nr:HIT family protein [Patescibacteria group bacterium]
MPCKVCRSISGDLRISPGPPIYEGTYWMVEHAYPTRLKGWLVMVLKEHLEAFHDLTLHQLVEYLSLQRRIATLLREHFGCDKEYIFVLGEAEGFQHLHVHMIPRLPDLSEEFQGTNIFRLLREAREEGGHPPEEIADLCRQLRANF